MRVDISIDEANLIVAGLNMLVKQHGLERPDIFQTGHTIMTRLKQVAAEETPEPETP